MTLKQKFEQWFINDEEDEHYEGMVDKVAIEHERIAEDFAIGFAEWKDENYFNQGDGFYNRNYKDEALYLKELLEIYKKEKGL